MELPVATCDWSLDSGGFTELNDAGRWSITPRDYADEVRRYRDRVGRMRWAAIQDWMVEPAVRAKTGRTVAEHQRLTLDSYHDLTRIAPEVPWTPVIQGWHVAEYLAHADLYAAEGVDLAARPIVGVGSVCRRQATSEAVEIFAALKARGLRLHGFGLKLGGLRRCAGLLASADSLAWSFRARRSPPLPGCAHKNCNNCLRFALRWRRHVLRKAARPCQSVFLWR